MSKKKVETAMEQGFLARFTFKPGCEWFYAESNGQGVVEILFPEDEDVYELIEFCEEHKDHIENVTVLLATGEMIDAKALTTASQET